MEPRPDGGKGGARDGNIFEVEQAPGLLMDLDVGDKAKVLIKYECQASGLGNGGDGGTVYRYRKRFQGNQGLRVVDLGKSSMSFAHKTCPVCRCREQTYGHQGGKVAGGVVVVG